MEVLRSLEGETGGDVHPLAGEKIGGKRKVRKKTQQILRKRLVAFHPLAGEKIGGKRKIGKNQN